MPSSLGRIFQSGLIGLAVTLCISTSNAQTPYYKGKRLTVLINFAPGGGVDISGRILARHIGKHIDGNPNVIVQNLDGAAGLNGVGYLGEIAPKDGTVIGYLGAIPWQFVSSPERFRVDLRSFEFIAYEPITTIFVVRTDLPPGMREPTDIVKAANLVSGGLGATHARDLNIRLALDMLGVRYRHVTGYSSTQKARLAMQRGEIHLTGETTPGYHASIAPLVTSGEVIPLFYNPGWDGENLSVPKQVKDLPVMQFQELYQKVKGQPPSGQLWDTYLANLALTSTMARLYALPPGTPPEAIGALRQAIQRLNQDQAFAEESKRAIGYVMESEANEQTSRQVRNALTLKPGLLDFVNAYIKRR